MMRRSLSLAPRASPLWRPRRSTYWKPPRDTRYVASISDAGEDKSGHIRSGPNEGVVFFNGLFPGRMTGLFKQLWVSDKSLPTFWSKARSNLAAADPAEVVRSATQSSVEIIQVMPRLKEGGAFVKFRHEPTTTAAEVAKSIRQYMKDKKLSPWWAPFRRVRAGVVVGKPWVEDLYRLPTPRLRVEFVPTSPGAEVAELSQEQLYTFFRPYGKLADIITQPSDSKIMPRFAYLDFTRLRKSVMAKNCMHGYTISEALGGGKSGTVLKLSYELKVKGSWIRDWIFGHPRLVIPILAALLAGITVAIFDPTRTWSIKFHITRAFHLEDNRWYRWFKAQANDLLDTVRHKNRDDDDDAGMEAVWEDRKDNIEQIQAWLMETADTFIIVQGARGSGKRELVVDQVLKHKKHKLIIDCKPIQEARGDAQTICAAAAEVGYRPVFSWLNSISGLVDLAAKGTTGVDTGFSETVDNQLAKIWNNTATALKSIALEGRKKDDKDANLSEDEYLEAHPERRPVVVVDNFLHKSQESSVVYDKLAEWAARITTSNIAHIIFLTNDVSFTKSLSKALPDRVFHQIGLGDCSPEVAKRYVINHLDFDAEDAEDGLNRLTPMQRRKDLGELDSVINDLGGRLTDLEFLARRIKAGETPIKAVKEIIDQSANEILKMFLLSGSDKDRIWTPQQAWTLVKNLADNPQLRYNELLLSDAFKSDGDAALQALESAELISIASSNGRPFAVRPGKPVYQPAFKRLTQDAVLKARMDLAVLGESIASESKSIDKYELELHLLGKLPKHPAEIGGRTQWLLGKIMASQAKIEHHELESVVLKKVLLTEY